MCRLYMCDRFLLVSILVGVFVVCICFWCISMMLLVIEVVWLRLCSMMLSVVLWLLVSFCIRLRVFIW